MAVQGGPYNKSSGQVVCQKLRERQEYLREFMARSDRHSVGKGTKTERRSQFVTGG